MIEPSECIQAHLIGQKPPSSTAATENGSVTTATLESSTTSSEVTEPDSPTAEEPETADDKAHLLQGVGIEIFFIVSQLPYLPDPAWDSRKIYWSGHTNLTISLKRETFYLVYYKEF